MVTKNILILVEGKKREPKLMDKLFKAYGFNETFNMVSYRTNIYTLYQSMFADGDPESYDLLQVLQEKFDKEENPQVSEEIFQQSYTDIILIFDVEMQDNQFKKEKIQEMVEYFDESTGNGKLYINYPMVEAFYHRNGACDDDYIGRNVSISDLKKYKSTVGEFTKDHNKLGADKASMTEIIRSNLEQARIMLGLDNVEFYIDQNDILNVQLDKFEKENYIYVLCTCIFFIVEYNKSLLD